VGKVLLIEDNEMDRDMLSRRLIRRGFQVVFAMDGQQGVDLARSERPDGDREKALKAGCDEYDTKPVEFDRLIAKIERLLGAAKA
jgi:CheY-like chemotaxis protein